MRIIDWSLDVCASDLAYYCTMVELKDALKQIDEKDHRDGKGSFRILFLTCHRDKRKGGEWISLPRACSMGLPPNSKGKEMRGILCMETGHKYAVHNRLIFQFNSQDIYWR